nr:PAAR domain-containing protein [Marinicella sp. W31]MDC2875916.1 PAAR domain-containing protein [Marinicella sp. W31]
MPPAHRKGDIGSGHGCHYRPAPATGGSGDDVINGKPAMHVGDSYAAHGCPTCPAPAYGRALAAGSPTVFINGRAAGRARRCHRLRRLGILPARHGRQRQSGHEG